MTSKEHIKSKYLAYLPARNPSYPMTTNLDVAVATMHVWPGCVPFEAFSSVFAIELAEAIPPKQEIW